MLKPHLMTAIAVSLLLTACSPKETKVIKPIKVVSQQLETRNFPIYGDYIALTRASLDVEVRARVNGYIEEQHFVEGSFVQKGELLYTLDAGPYKADLASAESELVLAKSMLDKSQRDIERIEPLFAQDAASQLDLDNAYSAKENAQSRLKASEAKLISANLNVGYTQIRAPIAGVTGSSAIDIGALAGSSGTSLLTSVQKVNPLFVEFQMSTLDYLQSRRRLKSYYEKIKADAAGTSIEGLVTITLPDGSEYPYPGQVKYTEPKINSGTGTFTARAEIPNPDRELLPGQYTRLRIQLDQLDNVLVIPELAVRFEQSGSFVFVVMPDKTIEKRLVVLERNIDGVFVVTSGLSSNEVVVIEGTHKVRHGSVVEDITKAEQKAMLEQARKSNEKKSTAKKATDETTSTGETNS